MGMGDRSTDLCNELKEELSTALITLGGIQQPCHCDHFDCGCDEAIEKFEQAIEDTVRDVAIALTGKEIKFS